MDSGTGTARRSTAHQDLSTYHWLRCESERDLETEKFEWFNGFCGVADRRVSACLASHSECSDPVLASLLSRAG